MALFRPHFITGHVQVKHGSISFKRTTRKKRGRARKKMENRFFPFDLYSYCLPFPHTFTFTFSPSLILSFPRRTLKHAIKSGAKPYTKAWSNCMMLNTFTLSFFRGDVHEKHIKPFLQGGSGSLSCRSTITNHSPFSFTVLSLGEKRGSPTTQLLS